jgi:signal transduction histidine kinase/CheY-like chemotaxis protein
MRKDKRRQTGAIFCVVGLNVALIVCVVYTVFSAFSDAENVSFSQNIENIRTLTDASANKVKLEIDHHTKEIEIASNYVNNYNGVGMTEDELTAYFTACYALEDASAWQLVDNFLSADGSVSSQGFDAISLCDTEEEGFRYQLNAYPTLAKIFCAADEHTLGVVQYTSEFTEASLRLAKSFAVTTTIRVRNGEGYQYKTLMLLITSESVNRLLATNNDVDSFSFFDYSDIIVDDDGNYVISNIYFHGTNFLDYIELYNDGFSAEDKPAVKERLKQEDYSDTFYYQNRRGQDCVYTIVPVQDSDWHILSIVPISSFHSVNTFNRSFINFSLSFIALFAVDIAILLITNSQLRKMTKKAKEANESKSLFLSSMSHDIRTPINAIVGMTLIADKQLEEPDIDRAVLQDCMKSIELSGGLLLTLINDILDISKIESGKIVLHSSDFSIADAVSQTINMCRSRIKEKDFVFEVHVQNVSHEYVVGDSVRINQIFSNILTNAVKYTEQGGKITVELAEEPVPGQSRLARYVYTVSDTGIGMTPEFTNVIFDRFTRAVDTRINSVEGTGLGMAIVKQLVDLMGGTIHVQSELNVGSTFTVTLELPIVQVKLASITSSRLSILLIDDDPILLKTMQCSLQDAGAAVDIASDGPQGIEMAASRHQACNDYRIIFVDWKLGRMSGDKVIGTLRGMLGADVRIIAMTAYNIIEIEQEARRAGADYFVSKPLFRSKLVSIVESASLGKDLQPMSTKVSFPDMKVLVVEDNDTNWKIMSRILKYYAITAERATNGRIAVEKVRNSEKAFELILMDIQMPVMNGYEATKLIRALADKRKATIPIYAMTADIFADNIRQCEQVGMDGHLSKPIDIKKVLAIIEEIYYNRATER